MAARKLHLRIVTPEAVKLDDNVEMVILRCDTGDMGIMPNREACSVTLNYGVLRIFSDGKERRMAIYGGIAQMCDNELSILTDDAQWPEDIDRIRAKAEYEEAERRLKGSANQQEIRNNRTLLLRSQVQLEVGDYIAN